MALGRWQATIVDTAGNVLPGAQVTVRSETTGALQGPETYTLSCSGAGGSDSASVRVEVRPTVALTVQDTTVESGGTTTLSWAATFATGCTASGDWSGAQGISGSTTVGPLTSDQTYTLTCSGAGGASARPPRRRQR